MDTISFDPALRFSLDVAFRPLDLKSSSWVTKSFRRICIDMARPPDVCRGSLVPLDVAWCGRLAAWVLWTLWRLTW